MISDLDRVCRHLKIRCTAVYGGAKLPDDAMPGTHAYKVTLKFQGRQISSPFFMGPAHTSEPTAADVLYCLCSDARAGEQTFGEFCSDMGYDEDSRKAEQTWKACVSIAPRLRRFLRDSFDEVANAQH